MKCKEPSCQESAISFSLFCWVHTSQGPYRAALQENINACAGQSTVLNLKRVDAENLDFSNREIPNSSFSQTKFSNVRFIGANLEGSDFIGSRLHACDFVGSDLSHSNFTRASLSHCSFSYSDLVGSCLIEAHLREVDFMGAVLSQVSLLGADLTGAKFLKRKNFGESILEENAQVASESYRALKHAFYSKGLYEDGSWAAYRELTMERKHFFKTRDPRYIPSLMMDLLSGYTEKPDRVILASLGIVLLFGILYYLFDAARPIGFNPGGALSFWDSIYFSFITFTTVGYGDYTPKDLAAFRILACIEAFSGPFMAGLYIFTLTRRYAAN